jgi:hypothetical protein
MSWEDGIEEINRFPKLREEMKKQGDTRIVSFLDNGNEVPAATLENAFAKKDIKNIKAVDSVVFVVEDEASEENREIWHKVTDFTSLRQLKDIKTANGGSLEGVRVQVTRIAVGSPKEPNWKYELVAGA